MVLAQVIASTHEASLLWAACQKIRQKKQFGISERSFRSIRLKYGLDRWTIRRLLAKSKETEQQPDNSFSLGYTPFGGAWLLIPLLLSSAIVKAISVLRMPKGVQVTAWQFVLTLPCEA